MPVTAHRLRRSEAGVPADRLHVRHVPQPVPRSAADVPPSVDPVVLPAADAPALAAVVAAVSAAAVPAVAAEAEAAAVDAADNQIHKAP